MPTTLVRSESGPLLRLPDTAGLVAWLFRDALIARLHAEIDELADDEHALDDQERRARENELLDALMMAERREETLIELAGSEGLEIPRRATADVRAVLGIEAPRRE